MFPQKIPENRRKPQKNAGKFLGHVRISFEIHQSYLKFDEDHEYVSFLVHSSIVEDLSVYFRCTSGKFEISHFLQAKSELCSPHSFHQFKHSFSKEQVVYLRFISV
jgi:hypothetical protein